jgi:ABC-type dipeptide/oligopeptide/nickel transport system permease component
MVRVLSLLALLLIVFSVTRLMVHALPGNPLETLVAESGTPLSPEVVRRELGLDRPFLPALAQDLSRAAHGDLGISLLSKQPIAPLIANRFLGTLQLAILGILLGAAAAVALGVLAAASPGGIADGICTLHGALMAAIPLPWKGPVLLLLFAVWIPIFPVDHHIALPAITIALGFSGFWARLIRERVRETLLTGAAPGARARGITEWKVLLKYGLTPASGALLAYLGTSFGSLLAGAFVTEVIFNWPGMGTLLVEAVLKRDYPVIESATFVAASACLAGTWLGDWAQAWVDPRKPIG